MIFDPNPLYYKMGAFFSENKNKQDKVLICNEGGSRSSKTWDFIHFLVTYCDHNRNKNKEIYVFRDTLTNCKDYTLKEFIKCFNHIGVEYDYKNPQKPTIELYGNNIFFRGLADEQNAEAAPSNVCFVNEMLDIEAYSFIAGWMMRCTELFVADWNPKFSEHWAFGLENRANCLFTKSTYKNNKHLPSSVIKEIESYDPSIPENIERGTADDYRHKVYGLGERASPEGLVFKEITWIDELPETFEKRGYGLDFGFTQDPTALVEGQVEGNNLYLKLHTYQPIDDVNVLYAAIAEIVKDDNIIADSSDSHGGVHMGGDLRKKGLNIFPCKKFSGSIQYGIDCMKRYKLHIVRNPHARKEAENYKYKEINGIKLNVPIDKHNHFWDAARYVTMSLLSRD
jgi:phage terminase large subunit